METVGIIGLIIAIIGVVVAALFKVFGNKQNNIKSEKGYSEFKVFMAAEMHDNPEYAEENFPNIERGYTDGDLTIGFSAKNATRYVYHINQNKLDVFLGKKFVDMHPNDRIVAIENLKEKLFHDFMRNVNKGKIRLEELEADYI